MKLPKIYYGYKKLKKLWVKQPNSSEKQEMIQALNESMTEIIEKYMDEFEEDLYKEIA